MKYYSHNIGDWLPATIDLSCLEEGAFRRLVDWCYSHEQPLPLTMRECCRIARCRNPPERRAVEKIIGRFFFLTENGWHNDRIDRDIATYQKQLPSENLKRDQSAERQRRAREKRTASFAALVSRGIQTPFNASQSQLDALLLKHGITQVVTRDATVTQSVTSGAPPFVNQEPINTGAPADAAAPRERARVAHAREAAGVVVIDPPAEPDRIKSASKALRDGGMLSIDTNVADPRFLALLRAGVTDEELRLTAAEASARGKGWGWLVAAIHGRHADIANGFAPRRPSEARAEAARDRVAALTPSIAAKPRNAH